MNQFLKKAILFISYFVVTSLFLQLVLSGQSDAELAGRLMSSGLFSTIGVYFWTEVSRRIRKHEKQQKSDLAIGLVAVTIFSSIINSSETTPLSNLLVAVWSSSWLYLYNFKIVDKFWGIKAGINYPINWKAITWLTITIIVLGLAFIVLQAL